MGIMFRTPDILSDITKQSHYDELDNYHDESIEVQKTEVKLLRTLYRMIEEKVPLSQTQLMKRANPKKDKDDKSVSLSQEQLMNRVKATNGTVKYYDYIFKDMVDMLCLFNPAPKRKSVSPNYQEAKKLLDKNDIHDFDTLQSKAFQEIIALALTAGMGNDKYAALVDDLHNSGIVNKTFNEKAVMPTEAAFSFLGQRYIHPDFVSLDINEMKRLVFEKYKKVQELKAEYDRLKAE